MVIRFKKKKVNGQNLNYISDLLVIREYLIMYRNIDVYICI